MMIDLGKLKFYSEVDIRNQLPKIKRKLKKAGYSNTDSFTPEYLAHLLNASLKRARKLTSGNIGVNRIHIRQTAINMSNNHEKTFGCGMDYSYYKIGNFVEDLIAEIKG